MRITSAAAPLALTPICPRPTEAYNVILRNK